MADNSTWDKTTPLNTDAVSLGDDQLRAFKTHMEDFWEEEHYLTDGSSASAGVHKIGSARCYQQSTAPSPIAGPGRLWHDTDDNSFWVSDPTASSWLQVSSDVGLGDNNVWTVRQNFVTSATTSIAVYQSGDANYRFEVDNTGDLWWGSGSATPDVRLYRSGVNTLETPDNLEVNNLTVNGGSVSNLEQILAVSDCTVSGDFNIGTTGITSIYSTGGIFQEAIGAPGTLPTSNDHGVLFIHDTGSQYNLSIRWGDGTTDIIVAAGSTYP
jgi:hypothetical protein